MTHVPWYPFHASVPGRRAGAGGDAVAGPPCVPGEAGHRGERDRPRAGGPVHKVPLTAR
ncbi:hypothetical protein SCATT_52290 [Streptantibioticus cattleyicolor NRRL 8057 = DSM 46488]|uniref:Uncharacterized protein n=1 Tax=Streptantibioticus cattleyicolor (strain ATCC 35852 / DSM 46488 / JCM 4925 / NBRC 14057 / NRRL 8057) TaxID=1003195 RepID=G8WY62_STREN|nr:hypothetical protein SCATT_52290 [Streptantibioticus cattleyicolor NRRL 8057 = DSM 46488]